jgi:hypothetical protein|tara:strand:+ start:326 stop:490 length:165 start_codon:yes stop_codon:yes gene_type:complete
MDLNNDEIVDLIDCVNNRIDDLTDCSMYGDAIEIEGEIERMNVILNKLSEALEA